MRSPRKVAGLVLACVTASVLGVGTGGTAEASIIDTPGYWHLKNGDSNQCLMANASNGEVEQWRCLNTASEEWTEVPITGHEDHRLVINHWTGNCMAIPNYPSNGTPVIHLPCDDSDVRQWWRTEGFGVGADDVIWNRFVSFQGVLCLDKDKGNNTQGLQIQMWKCSRPLTDLQDQHWEQLWGAFG